jgi:hypothetical protein
MPASTRIKAQNILFKFGATEYACDANLVQLTLDDAPGDVQTFCEVRVGGQWSLQLDGIVSGLSSSLYRVLWDNFGSTANFTIAPNGNAVASSSEPHYTGVVTFDQIPPLALVSNETAVFSVTLTVKNTPHTPASDIFYGVTVDVTA